MKYKDGLELQSLRREQDHIHRLVRTMDDRIERLAQSVLFPGQRTGDSRAPAPSLSASVPEVPGPSLPAEPCPEPTQDSGRSVADSPASPRPNFRFAELQQESGPMLPDAVTPETPSCIQDSEAKPSSEPPTETSRSANGGAGFEFELGRVWLVRIGIVVLLTGLVFLGNLAYQHIVPRLAAGAKLGLIVASGGALAGVGAWLEKRRESLRNYARVLMAGGFAAIYYACYAAHFVNALRVIESAMLGGGLLLGFAGGIAWFAHRRRSETLASLAVLLSYYTSSIDQIGSFTLFSNVLLTAAAVFFLVKNRWTKITYLSVAATYASYAYWRFYAGDSQLTAVWIQVAFLACYWLLFTTAAFLTNRTAMPAVRRTSFATGNNAAFFALAAHAISAGGQGEVFWVFSLVFGCVLIGLSKLAALRDPEDRTLDAAYLTQGLALTSTGLVSHLTGQQLALTFAAQGTVLLSCGRARQAHLLAGGGMLSLAASFLIAVMGISGAIPVFDHVLLITGITALVLLFNAWWFKRQRELVADQLHPVASAITGAAFIVGVGWLERLTGQHFAPWLAIAALGFAFVPFAEFALIAQVLLPLAVAKWTVALLPGSLPLPLDSVALLACGIVLAHWWPRVRRFDPALRTVAEGVAAFSSAALALLWMHREISGGEAMAVSAILGLVWILVARFTRAGFLSLAGLGFSVSTVAGFVQFQAGSHWLTALLPVGHVIALGRIFSRNEAMKLSAPAAALMLLWWAWEHIPGEWLGLFFASAAAVSALIGAYRRETVCSRVALGLGLLATLLFWSRIEVPGDWRDGVALLIVAASCRLARQIWPAEPMLAAGPIVTWSTVLGITTWVTWHDILPGHIVTWALLAFAFFAAGLRFRDRHYRLGGLALLGLAVARVFFVEVWLFAPLYRILSFIVLGIVLLIIGYAYNRFEEKLRRWF